MLSASFKDVQTVYDFPPALLPREQVMVTLNGKEFKVALVRTHPGAPARRVALHRPERDGWWTEPLGLGESSRPNPPAPFPAREGGVAGARNPSRALQDQGLESAPVTPPSLAGRVTSGRRAGGFGLDPKTPTPNAQHRAPGTEQLFWVPRQQVELVNRVRLRWENYREAWTASPFSRYLVNTLIVTLACVVGQVLSGSLVAFGFARLNFPGRGALFFMVLATMMLPGHVTMIPAYLVYRELGWIDTFLPLTVPAYLGGAAFYIFLFRQFFLTLPRELDEVARLDGCSSLRIYWNVLLPLCKPIVATVATFSFIAHWNDFMTPLIYLNSPEKHTLAIGLRAFQGTYVTHMHLLMAAATLVLLPVLVIFFFAQKQFIKSVALTGLKG